jgi:hypothetical protein
MGVYLDAGEVAKTELLAFHRLPENSKWKIRLSLNEHSLCATVVFSFSLSLPRLRLPPTPRFPPAKT